MIQYQKQWWDLVKTSLVEIYSKNRRQAAALIREYQKRLTTDGVKLYAKRIRDIDLLYHDEPLYVAQALVGLGTNNPSDEIHTKYQEIKEREWGL